MTKLIILIAAALLIIGIVSLTLRRRAQRRTTIRIEAPRAKVWETLTDIGSHPRWLPQLEEAEQDGERRWRCVRKDGVEQRMEVTESTPQQRAVWSFNETHHSFEATWVFKLEEIAGATTVRATHCDNIPSPLARAIALIRGGRDVALREFLEHLKIECERVADPG